MAATPGLTLSDRNFLLAETRETPMHVGALNLYSFPEGVDEQEFLNSLRNILTSTTELRPPFAQRLSDGLLAKTLQMQQWEDDDEIDLDYHIRHSALPKPGRFRELFALTSRLHSTLLDRNRPLWEMHLIEGLENRQFATYLKIHHSVTDGVGAIHLMQSMMSTTPEGRVDYSPLSSQAWESYKQKAAVPDVDEAPDSDTVASLVERFSAQIGSTAKVTGAMANLVGAWLGTDKALNVPWNAVPKGLLSQKISGSRRFVAQSWSYERIRGVGKALGCTLNDTVLAICGGAVRRYLDDAGELPNKPLKAMVPVSLRKPGDLDSANAVGFIIANLATNLSDPAARLRVIQESMNAGKEIYSGLSTAEATLMTQLSFSPLVFSNLLDLGSLAPAYNLVVSNVPGPRETMYWNGAQLQGIYPANIVLHGQALSITLVSYAGELNFGITACRQTLPHVQRLIDDLEYALVELETIAKD